MCYLNFYLSLDIQNENVFNGLILDNLRGCSIAWLALEVWDFETPVQIRASPLDLNSKKVQITSTYKC
jgi:hypothetical protein